MKINGKVINPRPLSGMTLDKAIEILITHTKDPCTVHFDDLKEAEMLGIEALKRVKACRPVDLYAPEILLPGETEE